MVDKETYSVLTDSFFAFATQEPNNYFGKMKRSYYNMDTISILAIMVLLELGYIFRLGFENEQLHKKIERLEKEVKAWRGIF